MRDLENGKGSMIASARISKTSGLRYFGAGRKTTPRPFASYEALLGFKTTAATETKIRI
jgi:hypothetical protein